MSPRKSPKTIAIASDHAGYSLKTQLKQDLMDNGYSVLDLGADSLESVDYPDFGYALASAMREGKAKRGVLICGSGIGISMAANRHPDIRAALVHDALGARMSRLHNDANVICFGGRMIGPDVARDCLNVFLKTKFEGGRHKRRVDKLSTPPTGKKK
jgi:ribose 5-phosphate isomerase B